jgi:hypothetical protein
MYNKRVVRAALVTARHRNPRIPGNFTGRQSLEVVDLAWWSEREANEDVA